MIDAQLAGGTRALVVAGSTGEAAALDDAEYSQLVEHAVSRVARRVPVLAGSGLPATAKTIAQTRRAVAAGIDFALVVAPAYVRPTQEGMYRHFSEVADHADVPIVLYNVPTRTACDLRPETVARLAPHGNIVGIKEAVADEGRMYANSANTVPLTVPDIQSLKRKAEKIVAVTAYDASIAARADEAGVDLVLVGDSLGMVVQGHASTLPVTMDAMVYHTTCVARGLRRPLLVADLPFMSFREPAIALANSARLLGEGGAAMVKLEGADWVCEVIHTLKRHDVPVCAHLGLTPQSVLRLGGYRVQGRDDATAARLRADARAVQDAGADLLVLECVPAVLAAQITRDLAIPTIGIGAGVDCDGQVLVMSLR